MALIGANHRQQYDNFGARYVTAAQLLLVIDVAYWVVVAAKQNRPRPLLLRSVRQHCGCTSINGQLSIFRQLSAVNLSVPLNPRISGYFDNNLSFYGVTQGTSVNILTSPEVITKIAHLSQQFMTKIVTYGT
jgi:hypothetical protein